MVIEDEPLLTPAGENLEHNTAVAARPNLNADGAFTLPPLLGRRIEVQGGWFWGGGRGGSLKNWTEVQFASWPLWCGGIYAPAFKLSGEMCQKLVSAGARGIKIYPSYMFFQQNKFDDYLNDFEMRAWQVPGNGNGAFVTIQSRENTHFEVTLPHSFFSLSVRLVLTSF